MVFGDDLRMVISAGRDIDLEDKELGAFEVLDIPLLLWVGVGGDGIAG